VVEPIGSGALWRAEFAHLHRLRQGCSAAEASFVAGMIYPSLGASTPLSASQVVHGDHALGVAIREAWSRSVAKPPLPTRRAD